MIVFFRGEFLPEERAMVSIFDRCLCYGDGLFETFRICQGRPFRWTEHIERLTRGARAIGIDIPLTTKELAGVAAELITRAGMPNSLLRLVLSRGTGPRGYSPKGATEPWVAMSLHPLPGAPARRACRWRLVTSSRRVADQDAVAAMKSCNRLVQVLARREAESAGANEALLLNTRGYIAEASSANVFWIQGGGLRTPPLSSGALDGITRAVVFGICEQLGVRCRERNGRLADLRRADGVFLTLSSLGIVEAVALDGSPLRRSAITRKVRAAYERLVKEESPAA